MPSVPRPIHASVVVLAAVAMAAAGVGPIDAGLGAASEHTRPGESTGRLVFDGTELHLAAEAGQVVGGETARPPGTRLTVVLRSASDRGFIVARETTVEDDGGFTAAFDLRGIEPPREATVNVYAGDERLIGPVEATIVARMPGDEAGSGRGVAEVRSLDRAVAGLAVILVTAVVALLAVRR